MYQNHSDYQRIANRVAGAFVNLALAQDNTVDILQTLKDSRRILDRYPDDADIQLRYAMTWFNLTLRQDEADISDTVTQIADFLRSHLDALPEFREALKEYLEKHPEHTERYRLLQEL